MIVRVTACALAVCLLGGCTSEPAPSGAEGEAVPPAAAAPAGDQAATFTMLAAATGTSTATGTKVHLEMFRPTGGTAHVKILDPSKITPEGEKALGIEAGRPATP